MNKFVDFFEAWQYLQEHAVFYDAEFIANTPGWNLGSSSDFQTLLNIDVVKINPKTNCIDDDKNKNTVTRVWLEIGPWSRLTDPDEIKMMGTEWVPSHDIRLDSGGASFEEAIIKLANKVEQYYPLNNYGKVEFC